MFPQARQEKLLVQEVGEELVIYDQERHRAHRLNQTAACVWRHCDGQTSVPELAALLASEWGAPPDEKVVWVALKQLEKTHLLRADLTHTAEGVKVSRRDVVGQLTLAGGLSLLLPVVTSITTPTPALAQYGGGGKRCGCACSCRNGSGFSVVARDAGDCVARCDSFCGGGPNVEFASCSPF